MRMRRRGLFALALLAASLAAGLRPAAATQFRISPIDLGSGMTISGTITTDGSIGPLSGANITSWNLTVTTVTDIVYTTANTANRSSAVTCDGEHLLVPTSVDGVQDGGSLTFYGRPEVMVQPADFSGLNTSGGQAFFVYGGAFDFHQLNLPNNIAYVAATRKPGSSTVYDLTPVDFGNGLVMAGTIATDGTTGAAHLVSWNIVVRQTDTVNFTPANSRVMRDMNLITDGRKLVVRPFDGQGNPGSLMIGYGAADPTAVFLGDYTWDQSGVTGYVNPFGMQIISNLPLDSNGNYVVASAPDTLPDSYQLVQGTPFSGGLSDVFAVDHQYLVVKSRPGPSPRMPEISVVISGTSPVTAPSELRFASVGHVNTVNVSQTIELYDFVSGAWVHAAQTSASMTDSQLLASAASPTRFVEPGTRRIMARVSYKATGATFSIGWRGYLDQAVWNISP